jgi:AhpD family alkylhydroperoxidase
VPRVGAAVGGPRVAPGRRAQLGLVNSTIARLLGAAVGGDPPNLFTTLGRHRSLFRRWLFFASALMPGGKLPRADGELLILRVAHNSDCGYEWDHHRRIAVQAGLSSEDVERVRSGAEATGWSERQRLLLRAADELHGSRRIADPTWDGLRGLLDDAELIELCMLVGHYEMLAMTLNSLGVEQDEIHDRGASRASRLLQAAARRSGRA